MTSSGPSSGRPTGTYRSRAARLGPDEHLDEAQTVFLHFIATGTLPVSESAWTLLTLQQKLHEQVQRDHHFFGAPGGESAFCRKLLALLLENHQALPRLLGQVGERLLEELYGHTMESGIVSRWISWLSDMPGLDNRTLRWKTLLLSLSYTGGRISLENYPKVEKGIILYLLREMQPPQLFRFVSGLAAARLEKLAGALDIPLTPGYDLVEVLSIMRAQAGHLVLPTPLPQEFPVPDTYIDNAGLVLLAAFLPSLFGELGWFDGAAFGSDVVHQRAVLLTQHLVRPSDMIPEYSVHLNKLLCGYPSSATLPLSFDEDNGFEQERASALLSSVLRQWTLNGNPINASVSALRESFLHRRGKLVRRHNGWLLHVEQKAYDVVLNGLTWNIRMIQLPWMKEALWVEWV